MLYNTVFKTNVSKKIQREMVIDIFANEKVDEAMKGLIGRTDMSALDKIDYLDQVHQLAVQAAENWYDIHRHKNMDIEESWHRIGGNNL